MNAAEKAISTFKNYFIAGMCTAHQNFLLNKWDSLLPQAVIKLNLLRTSRLNPKLSAHALLNRLYDFNATLMPPPGSMILVHEKSALHGTWAAHDVNAWYLGPALHHYRCYHIYIAETCGEHIADTVVWFPTKGRTPMSLSTDLAIAAVRNLIEVLRSPYPASPISPLYDSKAADLKVMAEIFNSTFEEARNSEDEESLAGMSPISLPGDNQPAKEFLASEPRLLTITSTDSPTHLPAVSPSPPVQPPNTAPEPRVERPPIIAPPITYAAATTQNRNATRRRKKDFATPKPNKKSPQLKSLDISKLVMYTVPTPKSRHNPVKEHQSPIGSVYQKKSSATRR